MSIPKDPYILLSFINTKLRDEYGGLEDLCKSLDLDAKRLEYDLSQINYSFDSIQNRFILSE